MKVVCDEAVLEAQSAFGGLGIPELCLLPATEITPDSILGADALIVRSTVRVDAELLREHTPKFIGTATVGWDHVDLDLLEQRGCHFSSARGSSAPSVAQFTWALIAHLAKGARRPLSSYRLGVVGCGAIGERVARAGEHLGLDVQRVDPPLAERSDSGRYATALDHCDLVSLHVPLSESGPHATANLVDTNWISALPKNALVINTARGGIVSENCLLTALRTKNIGGAALDVFPNEPAVNPDLVRCCSFATPHMAGRSAEGMKANTRVIAESFRAFFDLPALEASEDDGPRPVVQILPDDDIVDFLVKVWDLPRQDRLMKELTPGNREERAAAFRQLRRPPYRHDLTSYAIEGHMSDELERFMNALRTTNEPI